MESIKYEVTEISVVYRPRNLTEMRPKILSSSESHQFILEGFDLDTIAIQEQFVAMYLNRANEIMGLYRTGVGGITGVVADPRLILGVALKIGAVSLVVAHNHPSCNLSPSKADEEITRKLRDGAKLLDLKLLDHLILSPTGTLFYSFADEGNL